MTCQTVKFGEVFNFLPKSKLQASQGMDSGSYKFFTSSLIQKKWVDTPVFNTQALVFGTGGSASIHYVEGGFATSTDCLVVEPKKEKGILPKYVYYYIASNLHILEEGFKGAGLKHISKSYIEELEIPLPSISEQRKIVTTIDKSELVFESRKLMIQRLDDLAQSVFVDMFGDRRSNKRGLQKLPLNKIAVITSGSTPSRAETDLMGGDILWIKTTELVGKRISDSQEKLTKKGLQSIGGKLNPINSILVAMYGQGQTRGRVGLLDSTAATNQACGVIRPSDSFSSNFMFWQLKFAYEELRALGRGGNQENLNLQLLGGFEVLLPSLSDQLEFDSFIAKYELVRANIESCLNITNSLKTMVQLEAFKIK